MSVLWPRHVPPAWTPLSLSAIGAAALDAAFGGASAAAALRAQLSATFAATDVVLLDSGTHALELALRVAHAHLSGVSAAAPVTSSASTNLRVALPAYSCFDLATAAISAGARVELYDLDPATLAPDFDSLARAFENGVRVAVVSPLYGVPVDWDACASLAARFGALLVEDAAQGQGASWRGHTLGSLGALSVLSFGRGKGWTGGGGGALLVRGVLAQALEGVSPLPRATWGAGGLVASGAQCLLSRPALFGATSRLPGLHVGETLYHSPTPAAALPMTAAALLLRTRSAVDREAEHRRVAGAALLAAIERTRASSQSLQPIMGSKDGAPGFLRFPCRIVGGSGAVTNLARARRAGLGTSYPSTLAALAPLRAVLGALTLTARYPGAELLVRELVTLPTHSQSRESDRAALLKLVSSVR